VWIPFCDRAALPEVTNPLREETSALWEFAQLFPIVSVRWNLVRIIARRIDRTLG
jgi:hypothetical protein